MGGSLEASMEAALLGSSGHGGHGGHGGRRGRGGGGARSERRGLLVSDAVEQAQSIRFA